MCLSRLWYIQYVDVIHLSAQVILVDLETLQVIVKSNWQHTSFDETLKSPQPEFYGKASLSFQVICRKHNIYIYYIPINDTTLELSVFWPSDTENRINELRFSESISLSFKTRLTSVTCFCGDVTWSKFHAWNQRRKHDDVTSYYMTWIWRGKT